MIGKNGPWKIKSRTEKYKSELLDVCEDEVIKPDGEPGTYSTLRVKAGVSVLALDDEGFVYLAKDFRYAVGRQCTEAVAGAIDEGESHLEAAQRELREELGIKAKEWAELDTVDPMTSLIDSPSHLFLATGLTFMEKDEGSGENITTVKVKLSEAVRMVMQSDITHGSSCVLILRAVNYLEQKNAHAS